MLYKIENCYQGFWSSTQIAHVVQMIFKPRVTIRSFFVAHPVTHSLHKGVARKRLVEVEDRQSEIELDGAKQLGETSELEAILDLVSETYGKTQIA